jgi:hypothetical protein
MRNWPLPSRTLQCLIWRKKCQGGKSSRRDPVGQDQERQGPGGKNDFGKFKMERVSSCFKEIQTIKDSSGNYFRRVFWDSRLKTEDGWKPFHEMKSSTAFDRNVRLGEKQNQRGFGTCKKRIWGETFSAKQSDPPPFSVVFSLGRGREEEWWLASPSQKRQKWLFCMKHAKRHHTANLQALWPITRRGPVRNCSSLDSLSIEYRSGIRCDHHDGVEMIASQVSQSFSPDLF